MSSTNDSTHIDDLSLVDVGIPVIILSIDQTQPVVETSNTVAQREFNISLEDHGKAVSELQLSVIPHSGYIKTAAGSPVDVSIVSYNSTVYLRMLRQQTDAMIATYIDAEEELQYQQHIDVLHRIFRHNLRNGVNSIMGWAQVVQNNIDDPETVENAVSEILVRSEKLSRLSEEASRLEQILHGGGGYIRPIDVNQVVTTTLSDYDSVSEQISSDIPQNMAVLSRPELYYVIDNLIDNAFRHNCDDVEVEINARSTPQFVKLTIADDGKGLPQVEQDIINGDSGIDKLNHTDGLGLWIANWILSSTNAEFNVSVENGTKYTIKLHKPDPTLPAQNQKGDNPSTSR
jgi:signal transduction histidine kinase